MWKRLEFEENISHVELGRSAHNLCVVFHLSTCDYEAQRISNELLNEKHLKHASIMLSTNCQIFTAGLYPVS